MKFFSFTGALLGILSGWIAFGAAPEPGTPSAEVGPSTPFLENEPVLEGESPGYPVEPRTWYGRFRAQMLDRNA
ncbi:MAG: hypothetical protein JO112_11280, partial [Planctomycetes bacterium]|nr:hypothetical protein [Planctomycetota bacterium]